jgi:hypothetical protein
MRRNNVRVIRDLKDSSKDYWIPTEMAEKLFKEGELIQIEAYSNGYNNKWCFATKDVEKPKTMNSLDS